MIASCAVPTDMAQSVARRSGDDILLPGIATVHSHAFQRALRGRTHRPTRDRDSFWTWRELMYQLVENLDPDTLFAITRYAFAELAECGVTAVGEFHYVHHDRGGAPYADRLALSHAVVEAAADAGLRLTLLRVFYERGGANKPLESAQKRFSDARVDDALRDTEALMKAHGSAPLVRVGLAPHSVRAVREPNLRVAASFAATHHLPLHMHVSEQRRENEECLAEHGRTPVEVLAGAGALSDRFTAVHATHLTEADAQALGKARAFASICRTTERDLGDGLPNIAALRAAGARLCVGTDSHASSDPFDDLRSIELDERVRTESRVASASPSDILRAGTANGYASLGWTGAEAEDRVILDARDAALLGASDALLDDAVVFSAGPRAVREVWVGGRLIVEGGRHVRAPEFREGYLGALTKLGLTR